MIDHFYIMVIKASGYDDIFRCASVKNDNVLYI